jgi:hypothetical protein
VKLFFSLDQFNKQEKLFELELDGLDGNLANLKEKFSKFYEYFNSKTEESSSDFDYMDFLISQFDVS